MVLKQLLQKMARRSCWLDQDEEPTEEAMQRGVEQSTAYLLFLSAGVLGRRFVQSEVRVTSFWCLCEWPTFEHNLAPFHCRSGGLLMQESLSSCSTSPTWRAVEDR